jgi:ABC-type lipoprotein export system ATPase subunit
LLICQSRINLRKRFVSYVFQGLELFDELPALENIELKNHQTGYKSHGEIRSMADAWSFCLSWIEKPASLPLVINREWQS